MKLTTTAFEDMGSIPSKFTCDGEGINPELRIADIPAGTQSLVLVMDDPDIPDVVKARLGRETYDHWVLYNFSPQEKPEFIIAENQSVGTQGVTSNGSVGYVPPCPPDGEHRYVFRVYALPEHLSFDHAPSLDEVEEHARTLALAQATLTGVYTRQ